MTCGKERQGKVHWLGLEGLKTKTIYRWHQTDSVVALWICVYTVIVTNIFEDRYGDII